MKKRVVGLDLIRSIAILFVFSLHFLLNSGYYTLQYNSVSAFVLTICHWLVITCISLFLLLTGYLNKSTKNNKQYLLKLSRVLISYLIVSILCVFFRSIYLNENLNIIKSVIYIINFEACGYSWYVEMYIGLFLLIPFLNILYNNVDNKKRLVLIFILLGIIPQSFKLIIPDFMNFNVLPDRWINLYPVSLFYIGRYLSDNKLNLSLIKKILILFSTLLLESMLCYFVYYNKHYPGEWFDFGNMAYNNVFTVVIAVMIFVICLDCKISSKLLNKGIRLISIYSFEMYLISWMIDRFIYNYVLLPSNIIDYAKNYLFCVGFVFVSSFDIAIIVNYISSNIVKRLIRKERKYDKSKCNSASV